MTRYIVELEADCWLANGKGDPPRTLLIGRARQYAVEWAALRAIKLARRYRPFVNARVVKVAAWA